MTAKQTDVSFLQLHSTDIAIQLETCLFAIYYPTINYSYWKRLIPYEDDMDIMHILNDIFARLDCSVVFNGKRLLYTDNMTYKDDISLCYYYILHLEDQNLYNNSIEELCYIHNANVQFELNNPYVAEVIKPKTKTTAKRTGINKFVKQTTTDMFTGVEIYIYSNAKTGEIVHSENPDLLNELNGVKPKPVKKTKADVYVVPLENMTFNFKKKN